MRKADYAALAAIIKEKRAVATQNRDSWPTGSANSEYWRGQHGSIGDLAYKFSERASVDPAAFLKACGIE